MKLQCPHCGHSVLVNGLGRKPLAVPVINVYDALKLHRSVLAAANELGCSRAYVYKVLKVNGLKPKDVIADTQGFILSHNPSHAQTGGGGGYD